MHLLHSLLLRYDLHNSLPMPIIIIMNHYPYNGFIMHIHNAYSFIMEYEMWLFVHHKRFSLDFDYGGL